MLENDLFKKGYRGEVIISVAKFNAFTYIEKIANTTSVYKSRIHFTIDAESNNICGVIKKLQFTYNRNVVWGSGGSSCWPNKINNNTYNLASMNADTGVIGMSYIWTLDFKSSLRDAAPYFNGIITNYPGRLYEIVTKELNMSLATVSDTIPSATSVDVVTSSTYKCSGNILSPTNILLLLLIPSLLVNLKITF